MKQTIGFIAKIITCFILLYSISSPAMSALADLPSPPPVKDVSCYILSVNSSNGGADPQFFLANSAGCSNVEFVAGEVLTLTAAPEPGWELSRWYGTDDDSSLALVNFLTFPDTFPTVEAHYVQIGAGVRINEISTASPNALELFNAGNTAADLTGWSLKFYDQNNSIAQLYAIPDNFILGPHQYVILEENDSPINNTAEKLYLGAGIYWTDSGAAALLNGSTGMDFMRFGSSSVAPPASTFWTGDNPIIVADTSSRNQFSKDTDNGTDWCYQPATMGSQNSNCVLFSQDSFEPDNSKETSKIIRAGDKQPHSIYPAGDRDWVRFTLSESNELVLQTSGAGEFDTVLKLFNQAGSLVQMDDNSGPGQYSRIYRSCESNPLPAGTYYVWVGEQSDDGIIPAYTLSLNMAPCPNSFYGGAEILSDQPIVAIGRPHIGAEIMAYNGAIQGENTTFLPMLFNHTWTTYTSTFTIQNTAADEVTYDIIFSDALDGSLTCRINVETLPEHGVKTYNVTTLDVYGCTGGTGMIDGWFGGAVIESNNPVVAVARSNVNGTDAITYNGFSWADGAPVQYLPMLFRNIWGYESAFYVQNIDPLYPAVITLEFWDNQGNHTCTMRDSIPIAPSATRGYWLSGLPGPSMPCETEPGFPVGGWAGSVVILADTTQPNLSEKIVAIGRPHLGAEVAAYNGFSSGAIHNYLPMLFRGMWGYDAAIYIQNISGSLLPANDIAITFFDTSGFEVCTFTDPASLPNKATRGYWLPSLQCNDGRSFPTSGWAGSAEITTSGDVIAVGRPHLSDGQVVVYNAFTGGSTHVTVPMLFRKHIGSEAALYIQNLGSANANTSISLYDEKTGFYCTTSTVISPGAASAIWLAGLDPAVCVP